MASLTSDFRMYSSASLYLARSSIVAWSRLRKVEGAPRQLTGARLQESQHASPLYPDSRGRLLPLEPLDCLEKDLRLVAGGAKVHRPEESWLNRDGVPCSCLSPAHPNYSW